MELSNKALAVLLLAAMVISLGGTIISLNRMNEVQTVGYATEGTGTVELTIGQQVSIAMEDSEVDFESCTPYSGVPGNITTEDTMNTSDICGTFNADNLSVRNDGNVNASVTMNVSKVGKADNATAPTAQILLNSSSATSRLMYKTTNAGKNTYTGGCTEGIVSSYTALTNPVSGSYPACTNLKAGASANSFVIDLLITVPNDAPTGLESITMQFNAVVSGTP